MDGVLGRLEKCSSAGIHNRFLRSQYDDLQSDDQEDTGERKLAYLFWADAVSYQAGDTAVRTRRIRQQCYVRTILSQRQRRGRLKLVIQRMSTRTYIVWSLSQ